MFDFLSSRAAEIFNFDSDGDGILDSYAEEIDTDGDGVIDALAIDLDGDGMFDQFLIDSNANGIFDTLAIDTDGDSIMDTLAIDSDEDGYFETLALDSDGDAVPDLFLVDLDGNGTVDLVHSMADTDGDGVFDTMYTEIDTDGDGAVDTVVKSLDYNNDGNPDNINVFIDSDGDGVFDTTLKQFDSDGDGVIDTVRTFVDLDGDGVMDQQYEGVYLDTDGDGRFDTYVNRVDENGDGVFEAVQIFNVDELSGELELVAIEGDWNQRGFYIDDIENYDPSRSNPDAVVGDPEKSMAEWECQGATNRCALFSQKFVIEEMTGKDIDIEEFADIAEENGWFTEDGGTSPLNMDKMLGLFGIDHEMSFNNDMDDIQKVLESGGKVIVAIDADEIWSGETDDLFAPEDGANHAVEVIGIDFTDPDNPMVILNDSGHEGGCGALIPMDVFVDAWEDSNFQMIACI